MNNQEKKYDLIKFKDGDFSLDVNVSPEEETVWLTKDEISLLFSRDRTVISRHIKNIYAEKELNETTSCAKIARQIGDQIHHTTFYNLDVIISVGYRIKSPRGVIFRRWANSILKQYLLNGYAINKDRIIQYQSNILQLEATVMNIEKRIKNLEETIYSTNSQIIFEGEILEPYSFIMKLFFLANKRIIIIDAYADSFLLDMLININISVTIYTSTSSYINKHKENIKDNITVINTNLFHDRYIIIDDITYNLGTSVNSIGKKRFTISKLEDINIDLLLSNTKKRID